MTSAAQLDSAHFPQLRRPLLSWYDQSKRELPWRNTRDPYRIWVSEIMLQQTRVATVVFRYSQFLQRFPSVEKLAAARETSVLAEWSGMGYYRRARSLHAAAKIVAREGKFPVTAQEWRTLPGVGRYTAAAIASIAFEEPVAVLDGNVERLLRRLLGASPAREQLWSASESLLDRERPGDFNQAMMELGATVCLPDEPRCGDCPIAQFCRTRGPGKHAGRAPRQLRREVYFSLAERLDFVLLVRRPEGATLMPGMWELPQIASPRASDQKLFSLRHSITATDFRVHVMKQRTVLATNAKWIRISRLNTLPLTGLAKKILHRAEVIQ